MSHKSKKKRNKQYQGADARVETPVVTRMTAVSRHPLHQWLYDRRKFARPVAIAAAVVFALVLVITQIVRMIIGA